MRYIVIVGSSASHKRTAAREFVSALPNAIQTSFMAPLKHFVSATLGEKFANLDKVRMRPELNGHSVEQLFNGLRVFVRMNFGHDFFGRCLISQTLRNPNKKPAYVVVDDGGWPDDVSALPKPIIICIGDPNPEPKGPPADYIIRNGDGAKLWHAVRQIAKELQQMEG